MSDPTIQTFCCHHTGNKEDVAVRIMDEFNTESYNTVCLVSSAIGILGSLYQIFPRSLSRDSQRVQKETTTRGRHIIIWLATADLFASLGVLVRSSLWLQYKNIMPMPNDDVSVLFCSITSAWTQYFYTATWFWTFFYAVDTWRAVKGRDFHPVKYHSMAWGIPAATTAIGLSILYIPNATCHNLTSVSSALYRIFPNYCATYVPIAMVMVMNPIIYVLVSKHVELAVALPLAQLVVRQSWRRVSLFAPESNQGLKFLSLFIGRTLHCNSVFQAVWSELRNQFTSKERRLVDALRLKFFLINAAFYVCWLPNLVNGILIWTMWFNMPVKVIITIWYIMALFNPMQALLNALVYRKWSLNQRRCRSMVSSPQKEFNCHDEQSPLLGSEPSRLPMSHITSAINNYSTL